MQTPVEMIYHFNQQAGLLDSGYDPKLEASMSIEESLEDLADLPVLAANFGTANASPKHLSRIIVGLAHPDNSPIDPVKAFDKHLDALVINYGSLFKPGLTVDQVNRGLSAVMQANLAKLGMPKDEKGKLQKPDDFIGPELALLQILEE